MLFTLTPYVWIKGHWTAHYLDITGPVPSNHHGIDSYDFWTAGKLGADGVSVDRNLGTRTGEFMLALSRLVASDAALLALTLSSHNLYAPIIHQT